MSQICQKCKATVKAVRIDLDEPREKRQWICDRCYFDKDKNSDKITSCKTNQINRSQTESKTHMEE